MFRSFRPDPPNKAQLTLWIKRSARPSWLWRPHHVLHQDLSLRRTNYETRERWIQLNKPAKLVEAWGFISEVWVFRIPLIFRQNIWYPVNSCGSYSSNASYHDDVIERDMFGYLITKTHFSGAFGISNRNYVQIRHHFYWWYVLK